MKLVQPKANAMRPAAPLKMWKFVRWEIRRLANETGAKPNDVGRAYIAKLKPLAEPVLMAIFKPTQEQLDDPNFHFDFAVLGNIRDELFSILSASKHVGKIGSTKEFENRLAGCYAEVAKWFGNDAPTKPRFRKVVLETVFEILKREYAAGNKNIQAHDERRFVVEAARFAALRLGAENYFALEASTWKGEIDAELRKLDPGGLDRNELLKLFNEFAVREFMATAHKKGELGPIISEAAIRAKEHVRICKERGWDACNFANIPHPLSEKWKTK